jgi:hypothetical protein
MKEPILKQIFPDSPLRENLPATELLNPIRNGDIDAFNKFLKIRSDYYYDLDWKRYDAARYYDDLVTILHCDIRDKLIFLIASKEHINLEALEVLTRNYDIKRIKDKLYLRLEEYSLKLKQSKTNEKWNNLVSKLFNNHKELIVYEDDWKKFVNFDDVMLITESYPELNKPYGYLLYSAYGYLANYIESNHPKQNIVNDKFIGAYSYNGNRVWLYECEILSSKDDDTSKTLSKLYTISPDHTISVFDIYDNPNKGELGYREIVAESAKFEF